jgi:hypothetical protein
LQQQQPAPSGIDEVTGIYPLPPAVCGSAFHILCDGSLDLSSLIFLSGTTLYRLHLQNPDLPALPSFP